MTRLGQHFLKDKQALRRITEALEITSSDVIVEIGPGHGELTELLLEANPKKIIGIEKDPALAARIMNDELSDKLQVVQGNILKILPEFAPYYLPPTTNYKLTGNIPYYITGYLLRTIQGLFHSTNAQGKRKIPKLIVLTIQREVAERIMAKPPRMNLLAASVQYWGRPEIVGYIPKKYFRPQPKVDSAILKITPRKTQPSKKGAEQYYKFIKALFKQPRKTIFNNLRHAKIISESQLTLKLEGLKLQPNLRPGDLSLKDIDRFSSILRPN